MSDKLNLTIEGMHCGSCVAKVETALKTIENLENISTDVKSGHVEIEFNGDLPTEKTIRRIIDKAGYSLIEMK